MKKSFIVFWCLILMAFSVQGRDYSRLYSQLDKSVVIIYSDSQQVRSEDDQLVTSTESSLGSGTLINKEGLILTAAHVVNSADTLTVDVKGRGQYAAKVISSYQAADIALIKILSTENDFPAIALGDSGKAKIGNEVFVIGTPYGLSHTLTVGHLSGRRLHQGVGKGTIEFLQTDAAINQGNSGGPLFNVKGELIGVVSYIETQSGGNEGLGFAASSNMIKELLLNQPIIWFGLEFSVLNPQIAAALNVPQASGMLVEKVAKQSFAEAVGLRGGTVEASIQNQAMVLGGDVILKIGPHQILGNESNYTQIAQYLRDVKPGEEIHFKLLRMGEILELGAAKPTTKIVLE